MSTKEPQNNFFEVALSIGNSFDINEMLTQSIEGYTQKLDCSVYAIFQYSSSTNSTFFRIEEFTFQPTIPEKLKELYPSTAYPSKEIHRLWRRNVVSETSNYGEAIYLMSLPDFGFILLGKSEGWTKEELINIHRLNIKLATSALKCKISDELSECLHKNEDLAKLLPGIIYEADTEGNITYINKYALDNIIKKRINKNTPKNILEFIHPKDVQRAKENIKHILERDVVIPTEYTLVNTDGQEWVGLFYSNKIVEKGKIVGVRGVMIDITERKQIEQSFKEKSEKLELLLQESDAAIWEWDLTTKRIYVNERWSTMMGFSPNEIIIPHYFWIRHIHHDDLTNYLSQYRFLLDGEIPFIHLEVRVKTKEGSYKWIKESARVVEQNSMSNPTRIIGTHFDITDSKQIELSLTKSLKQQELISEISILLNSTDNFNDKLSQTLKLVGEFINVSRVYIFQNTIDNTAVINTHEWCNKGIKSELDVYRCLPYSQFPSWTKIIEKQGILVCNNINDLPTDILQLVSGSSILSLVEYPLYIEGKLAGFIGFDECTNKRDWNKWELELLKTVSNIVSNALERQKIESALQESNSTNKSIIESLPDRMLHITKDGILINFNNSDCGFCSEINLKAGEHIREMLPEEGVKLLEEGISQLNGQKTLIKELCITRNNIDFSYEFRFTKSTNDTIIVLARNITLLKQREKDLRRSEEKFRSYVENASDVILSASLQGKTLYVSPNIQHMLGYTQEEFINRDLKHYVHPDDLSLFINLVDAFQTKSIIPENMEYRMLHKNGEWRWVQVTSSLNCDLEGKTSCINILRDFTKDKLAQEKLQMLSLVADKSTNTVMITDKNHQISWVNDAFTKLTGYSFDEAVGNNPKNLLLGPETSPHDLDEVLNGLNTGEPFRSEILQYRKNGERYWIELYITPIYDEHGSINSYITVMNDITERRQREKQIQLLSKGIENSPAVVVVTNSEGMIEYVNQRFSEVTGYEKEEAIGNTPRVLKSGFHKIEFYEKLWKTIKSGQNWKGELYNRKKDGTYYWESATISPIVDVDNKITHFVAIKEDITQSKKLYQEMLEAIEKTEKATRAKSVFLATMSHEIRTPMNGVIGMTSLLAKTPLTDEQLDYVNTIRNSGETLLTIINDILDFSKIESGKMVLENSPFDMRQCVEDVVDLFWVKAVQKNIALKYSVTPNLKCRVVGDVTRLRQILVNLIGNAMKFTEKGSVEVDVVLHNINHETQTTRIGIYIKDTGIGIPKNKIDSLFNSFTQVDSSITRRFGGTGLGLAITKQLVDLMGGTIKIDSVENEGSTFSIEFKLKYVEQRSISAPHPQHEITVFTDVESENIRYILSNILEALNIRSSEKVENASAVITDKKNYLTYNTSPIIYLKEMGVRAETTSNKISLVTFPLKLTSIQNAIQKLVTNQTYEVQNEDAASTLANLSQRFPISILVAEDNTINQKLVNKALSLYGYTCDFAANGIEVLQALERQSYDLIFMDIQMPEMDGLEATRQIVVKYPENRPLIIAMTASALGADRDACLRAGMDDFVGKPIKIETIEDIILKWFNKS